MIHRYDLVDSTQDLAHRLAQDGAPAGTAVVAREQRGGRGSRGRRWHSPPGGLWMSVVCRPADEESAAVLSLRVGLATADLLERHLRDPVRLKWPNDLMLGDRKLGGILCEARWQGGSLGWVAVGLGLNVANPIPDDLRVVATSLREEGSVVEADGLAEPLAAAVGHLSALAGGLDAGELARFQARDWLAGRTLVEPAAGTAAGVDSAGQLLVQGADGGTTACRSGHVVLG